MYHDYLKFATDFVKLYIFSLKIVALYNKITKLLCIITIIPAQNTVQNTTQNTVQKGLSRGRAQICLIYEEILGNDYFKLNEVNGVVSVNSVNSVNNLNGLACIFAKSDDLRLVTKSVGNACITHVVSNVS